MVAIASRHVTERFTAGWLADLDAAVRSTAVAPELRLVIQQIVTDDGEDLAYSIRLEGGQISVVAGRTDDADVTFLQDRSTADAIADGTLSAQAAFMAGRLRVGGDLRAVLDRARGVLELDDLFAGARSGEP